MTQAVGVILSVMSLAYLVVMFVVQRPSLRKLAQLAREARRGESWPQTARGLSVAQRIRLARRTATGKPPADDTEAALLVARARFLLHVRDYLKERGAGIPSMISLLGWSAGFFAIQTAYLLVRLINGPAPQAFVSATVVLFALTVCLAIVRLLLPRLADREYKSLQAVVERHGPGGPESA